MALFVESVKVKVLSKLNSFVHNYRSSKVSKSGQILNSATFYTFFTIAKVSNVTA